MAIIELAHLAHHIHTTHHIHTAHHIHTTPLHTTYIQHCYTPHTYNTVTHHIHTTLLHTTYIQHCYTPHTYNTVTHHIHTTLLHTTYIQHCYTPHTYNTPYILCTTTSRHTIKIVIQLAMSSAPTEQSPPSEATKAEEWNNFKSSLSGMDRYGDQRLKLAVLMRDTVLNKINFPWIVENGNLLGAWRTGKFIPHDDDFDIAMFFEEDATLQLCIVFKKIKELLPAPYEARLVSSYCDKIEVFDPTYGNYILHGPQYEGADYHHVTLDIQSYERCGDVYHSLYNTHPQYVKHKDLYPLGNITLEGEPFQAPANVEAALRGVYGSLSAKAKYNKELGKYIDPEEESGANE